MTKLIFLLTVSLSILSQISLAAEDINASTNANVDTKAYDKNRSQKLKTGQIINKTNLLLQPSNQSQQGKVIAANSNIDILSRKRAWYNVIANKDLSGWVNMLNVRFTHSGKREGDLGLGAFYSSVTNDSLPTVSTGVRGFDDSDLAKAKADFKQVELLLSYTVSPAQAKKFAQQGQLKNKQLSVNEESDK